MTLYELKEKTEYTVRVNMDNLKSEGVVRICEIFHERYTQEYANGFFLMTFHQVTYFEFVLLISVYSHHLTGTARPHIIYNPVPHVDIHVTELR